MVEVAALHGLDLLAELDDVADDLPAAKQEKHRKQHDDHAQQDLTADAVIGVDPIVVEGNRSFPIRKADAVEGEPLKRLELPAGLRILPPLINARHGKIGFFPFPVKSQHGVPVAVRPFVDLFPVGAGQLIFVDVGLKIGQLLGGDPLLHLFPAEIGTQGFVQRVLHPHQQQRTAQAGEQDQRSELFCQPMIFFHLQPPSPAENR